MSLYPQMRIQELEAEVAELREFGAVSGVTFVVAFVIVFWVAVGLSIR